mgnify:CR=1 FL=1
MRMRDVITHRGPDEAGLHCDAHAALAHRRLSIVDLQHRPAAAVERRRQRLGRLQRRDLQPRGDPPRARGARPPLPDAGRTPKPSSTPTSSGATTASTGSAGCSRSRSGTRRSARLLLVRDRLGIKPLYWTRARDALLFGSEIKAILASGLVEAQPNQAVLPEAAQHALHVGRGDAVSRHLQAAARTPARLRRRRDQDATALGRSRRGRIARTASEPLSRARRRRAVPASCSRNRSGCG